MVSGAQSGKAVYRWMPMEAAAAAMNTTVHALRQRIVHGTLRSRMTPAGIPQVLVGMEPAASAMPSNDRPRPHPVEHPSPIQTLVDRLRWIGHRQGFSWTALYLALALLLAMRPHLKQARASSITRSSNLTSYPNENSTNELPRDIHSLHPGQPATQPTTRPIDLVDEIDVGIHSQRRGKLSHDVTLPTLDAERPPIDEGDGFQNPHPAIGLWESIFGFPQRLSAHRSASALSRSGEMTVATLSVGDSTDNYNVVLWLPDPGIQPSHTLDLVPFGTGPGATSGSTTTSVAAALRLLGSDPVTSAPNNGQDTGDPVVGGAPDPPGGDYVGNPEPSSAALFGLSAACVLLRRRRSLL
jgi:hypothetical protein